MKMKKNLFGALILSMIFLSSSLFSGTVEDQATAPNLHTYVIVSLPWTTQAEAESDLDLLFGDEYHLATITSPEEQEFIADLLDDNGQSG